MCGIRQNSPQGAELPALSVDTNRKSVAVSFAAHSSWLAAFYKIAKEDLKKFILLFKVRSLAISARINR